jgi:hypothetical protein
MPRRLTLLLIVLAALAFPAAAKAAPAASLCAAAGEVTFDPTPDDKDDDCVTDTRDNCPGVPNADQIDSDGDGRGDRCDEDDDNDGLLDAADNCRTVPNPDQTRTQHPLYGDACLFDRDGDGVIDAEDNCRSRANPDQRDNEGDGAGDVCDADDDNDAVLDERDNCPLTSNKDQRDTDGDGIGDACDPDTFTGPAFVAPPPTVTEPRIAVDRTRATVRLSIAGRQRAGDALGGMPARVACSEACSIAARLTIARTSAKRLKVRALLAKGEAALDGAGSTYVFLAVKRSAIKRLFRGRGVKATLALTVLDAAGNATTARRTLRLSGGA